jgi:DNA-binding LytR/AlgR family response regulator
LSAQYLAELLDDTCQVEIIGSATENEAALRLCAELRPEAVFLDINLPGKDGVSLARQLAMLPHGLHLWSLLRESRTATDAFWLEAVDYLWIRSKSRRRSIVCWHICGPLRLALPRVPAITPRKAQHRTKCVLTVQPTSCCRFKDVDRDQIRLLARREVVAVLRRERRTWVHAVREEFAQSKFTVKSEDLLALRAAIMACFSPKRKTRKPIKWSSARCSYRT